jgi:hypothetical protein
MSLKFLLIVNRKLETNQYCNERTRTHELAEEIIKQYVTKKHRTGGKEAVF